MKPSFSQSGVSTPVVIGVGAIALLLLVVIFTSAPAEQAPATQNTPSEQGEIAQNGDGQAESEPIAEDLNVEPADAEAEMVSETDEGMADENMVTTSNRPGTYEEYAPEKLALANDGRVVLFFHADWCPSCRALESDINANLSTMPANTHILQVDYDTATELKQKYGVVRQHTLVVVDANGDEVKTITGLTNTLEQVVAQI